MSAVRYVVGWNRPCPNAPGPIVMSLATNRIELNGRAASGRVANELRLCPSEFCAVRCGLSVFVASVLLTLAPAVRPEQNAKNVLVIFSTFARQQLAYLDLIESPVRFHFKGPVNFLTS
jgi:hypothetical protein